jgi:hypothetical protein
MKFGCNMHVGGLELLDATLHFFFEGNVSLHVGGFVDIVSWKGSNTM